MIGGATRGSGGGALGRHLSNEAKNEQVIPLEGRGLIARDVRDQVAELTEMGAHARTRTPLYHVHADPPADRPWSEDERRQYWERFEAEFGLEGRPFAAVGHLKDGRLHEHRVYLRIRDDGTAIRLDHDHARREKLHRLFEIERGEQLTPGAHNRAVIAAMEREGRHEAAQAMREAGLDTMERPRADTTPRQRAQAERTGADPRAVGAAALAAWQASDGGRAFAAALEERGLRLAQGTKAPVIIDAEGGAHPLARMLGKESKAAGTERIRAADVAARLDGLDLPRHAPGAGRRPAPADQVPEPERILVAEEAAPAEDRPGTAPSSADEAAAPSAADPIPEEQVAPTAPEPVSEAPTPMVVEAAPAEAAAPEPVAEAPAAPAGQAPAAAPAGAPKGGAAPGAEPSGGGDAGPGDVDFVAPLDPSKPGDVVRFLTQCAQAEKRKQAREAGAAPKGGHAGGGQQQDDGSWLADWLDQLRSAATLAKREGRPFTHGQALDLDGYEGRRPGRGHDAGPEAQVADRVRGQPGHDAGGLRRPADGGRHAAAGGRAPGRGGAAAEGERAAHAAPGGDASDGGRHRPDRAEAARARAANRRAARHLGGLAASTGVAASIKAMVAPPEDRVRQHLAAAQARVGAVLAKDPWPRDEDRDPKRVAEDLLGRRREAADQAKAAAEAARRQVRDRRRAAGLFGRLRPSTRRELQALAADAERAEQQADRARVTDGDRSPAEAQAKGVTTARIAERRRWHDSRDVQDARKADEELRLVREAVERRDPEITAAAAQGDLKRARELAVEQAEERRRQELEQALTGYEPGRGPSPGRGPGPAPSPRR